MPLFSLLVSMSIARLIDRKRLPRWLSAALLAVVMLAMLCEGQLLAQGDGELRRLPPVAAGDYGFVRGSGERGAGRGEYEVRVVDLAKDPAGQRSFAGQGSLARSTTDSRIRLAEYQEALPIPGTRPLGPPSESFEVLGDSDIVPIEIPLAPLGGCGDCGSCGSCGGCNTCGCWSDNCEGRTRIGRFFCGVYHGICCPDPCYDPQWKGLADSAFFTAAARPVTQSRFRWDAGLNLVLPDRAEYFWARSGGGGRGRPAIERSLTYHDLTQYNEVAHGRFSAFTEFAYRSLDPDINTHSAGFGDLTAGTKSLLFDCELLQITFQTKFITPTGNPSKGFGTGHLSIEPSLIAGINLGPRSYLQAQVAEWIPIGGDTAYEGAILHYHFAYNRTLLGRPQAVHVISSLELNGWSFQDGAFSDPDLGQLQSASGETYLSGAVGLRMIICEKVDFGFSYAQAMTENHWADQLFRSEMRVRF